MQPDDPIEDDSEESKILSFSGNEVATRQVDLQDEEIKPSEEKKKKGLESQTSPALKGTKVVAEEEAKVTAATDGVIGPGRTTVRNLKGDGDVDGGCWHILLYSRMRSGMAMSRRFLALLTPRPNRVKPRWQLI